MAILTRLARLARADAHHLLDQFEAPDVLLKQAIRDMQSTVDESRHLQKHLQLECRQLADRLSSLTQKEQDRQSELDLCLDAENEALARSLLRRRLEQQKLQSVLTQRHEELQRSLSELVESLSQREQKLAELKQKAEVLDIVVDIAECNEDAGINADWTIADDEIEVALLAEKNRRRTL